MEEKKWYKSKTVWVNALTVVAGLAPLLSNWTAVMSPTWYAVGLTVVGAANLGLRALTTQPIVR